MAQAGGEVAWQHSKMQSRANTEGLQMQGSLLLHSATNGSLGLQFARKPSIACSKGSYHCHMLGARPSHDFKKATSVYYNSREAVLVGGLITVH